MKKHLYIFLLILSLFFSTGFVEGISESPNKVPKVLVLIIASDGTQAYIELQKIWKAYMNSDPEHFDVYFVKGDATLSSPYEINGNDLIVKIEESYKPGIANKTVLALEALSPQLDAFDYVLRTNLSSFYVFPKLLNFLNTLPKTNCYCGQPMYIPDTWEPEFGLIKFTSGAGFIISTDLAKKLVVDREAIFNLSPKLADDVLFGYYFQNKNVPIIPSPRVDFSTKKEWYYYKNKISDSSFHFRARNNVTIRDPKESFSDELYIDQQLLKKFYGIDLNNIADLGSSLQGVANPQISESGCVMDKKIFLGLIIKNNNQTIPAFLKTIENFDYDKKLISLKINVYNDTFNTREFLKNWIEKNKNQYATFSYVENLKAGRDYTIANTEKFKLLGSIKNEFLKETKLSHSDYCFIVESDTFIAPYTLKYLLGKNKPVIAPLLNPFPSTTNLFRNFYVDTTESGYYKDHPDNEPIITGRKIGTFKVRCISCCYLIKADSINSLSFEDQNNDWEYLAFCRNANAQHVDQFICNEKEFGYFLRYDKQLNQQEERAYKPIDDHIDLYDYLFEPKDQNF